MERNFEQSLQQKMKNKDKKELLNKLKEIGNIQKRQRFSQKVMRGYRSNQSYEASFHKDHLFQTQEFNAVPITAGSSINQVQESRCTYREVDSRQLKGVPGANTKGCRIKRILKETETAEVSPSHSKYLSSRFDSSERRIIFEKKCPGDVSPPSCLTTMHDCSGQNSYLVRQRCEQKRSKNNLRDQKLEQLSKQIRDLSHKLHISEQNYKKLKKAIEPYKSNVELLSVIVGGLRHKDSKVDGQQMGQGESNDDIEQMTQLKETMKINKWLMKQNQQKDKKHHNQAYQIKGQFDSLAKQNSELKLKIKKLEKQLQFTQQQFDQMDTTFSLRQRVQMCGEELYSYKLRYRQSVNQNTSLLTKIQQQKYKVNVLTSLIGCAIIFDVQQKEKDNKNLKEILNQIDQYENIAQLKIDNQTFQYLKILKSNEDEGTKEGKVGSKGEIEGLRSRSHTKSKTKTFRRIYYPNYMILLGEESVSGRVDHTIIKPTLFIKIRSLLDSKYIDYRLYQTSASKFPQFCNFYIKNYDIQSAGKKHNFINKILTQNEVKQSNLQFIRYLMDERIHDLPEIEVFRDFMMGKYEEDQIYFYLMCRHKFVDGSEVENYISSGDPSKFIRFQKAKRVAISITENFGRNIQNFICYHINFRKISKNASEYVRLYYILKLLLLVYRKIRTKKMEELKEHFDSILLTIKKDRVGFLQFSELLRKNFDFLTRCDLISMYQLTLGIFQSQRYHATFYECFAAACSSKLFLKELIKFDMKLGFDCEDVEKAVQMTNQTLGKSQLKEIVKKTMKSLLKKDSSGKRGTLFISNQNKAKETTQPNPLNELWPDSIYSLGNERLSKQFVDLLNSNSKRLRTKLDILQLLLNASLGHLVKQDKHLLHKQDLALFLNTGIKSMTEYLNKLQNSRLQHQNEVNQASRKLGRFFKNKTYQFYHQMLQDINKINKANSKGSYANMENKQKLYSMFTSMK